MQRDSWKRLAIEGWAFVVVAIIAFVGGLLIGDLGGSPKSEIVYVAAPPSEAEGEAESEGAATAEAPAEGGTTGGPGAETFASAGCASCHTLAAAGSTGVTGPDLNEFLETDDTTEGIEEMITKPNIELAEGYPANVMPQTYAQTLSKSEVHQLAEYLVATTTAQPNPPPKSG